MTQREIPKSIQQEASRLGFNSVSYAGRIDGVYFYSVGVLDRNGEFAPVGLPTFIALEHGKTSWVSGDEGLELSLRLD